MPVLAFLILFPLLPALLLSVVSHQGARTWIVRLGVLALALAAVLLAKDHLASGPAFYSPAIPHLEGAIFAGEMLLYLYLLWRCRQIRALEAWVPLVLLLQAGVIAYTRLGLPPVPAERIFGVDNLSILMALIIAVVGGLVCAYAVPYMKDFHDQHPEIRDRRRPFFFLLFLFLSAMFGIVFSNHLGLLFFFWEITSLCCFLLIRYAGSEESIRNAYRALGLNLLGGLAFALGLWWLSRHAGTLDLDRVVTLGKAGALAALVPVVLISFAGLTKAAQLPFQSWLLGAMVAPTPVSALLHSSTMVKAGVFIILKFSPVFLAHPSVGMPLALLGGLTFLVTSLAAVTQSNAKRVLAYSTVANLGLVVACAGVGSPQAVWAALLLVLFHAVSKGLLFQAVGAAEHGLHSRDIEDMEGLITARPALALAMLVGILGMFLAPFGMLVGKWACLQAFLRASPLLALLLAFGSAPTLFFWAKWMGKLASVAGRPRVRDSSGLDEWVSMGTLAVLTLAACGLFPLVSRVLIEPYLAPAAAPLSALGSGNLSVLLLMLGLLLLLPLAFLFYPRRGPLAAPYLGGANRQDEPGRFLGSLGRSFGSETRNYYLANLFSEKGLLRWGGVLGLGLILAMFLALPGSAAALPGPAPASLPAAPRFSPLGLLAYLVAAPLAGGLLAGADRVLTARLQGRVGPPLLQPFWDVAKLLKKRAGVVNRFQDYYVACFALFAVLAGGLFFAGGDLLLVIFALTLASVFLVLAGYSPHSPYSAVGADRELLQMMAYEPMLLILALGAYQAVHSFQVSALVAAGRPLVFTLPGVFLGLVFVVTIKLRKSPFDLSTSHHGHQELVKGLTTDLSGPSLAWVEVAHWYENVLLLGFVYLFFAAWPAWAALAATALVYALEVLADNACARLDYRTMIKSAWVVAGLLGAVNVLVLSYFGRS